MAPSNYLLYLLLALQLALAVSQKTKRQIYREQVVPFAGGKIPEDAFRVDRLALNRLNKDGISIPDGVVLDARGHHKHPSRQNSDLQQSVVKVLITPENRYTSHEGTYHPQHPVTVDSTYVIRPPVGSPMHPSRTIGRPIPGPPLQIPNPHLSVQPPAHRHIGPARDNLYFGFPDGGNSINNFLLPENNNHIIFPESINTFSTNTATKAFPDFDTLLAHLNERAQREATAALAASAPKFRPWPSKLHGVEGIDFPALTTIPQTSFQCGYGRGTAHRMLADPDTKCQTGP